MKIKWLFFTVSLNWNNLFRYEISRRKKKWYFYVELLQKCQL